MYLSTVLGSNLQMDYLIYKYNIDSNKNKENNNSNDKKDNKKMTYEISIELTFFVKHLLGALENINLDFSYFFPGPGRKGVTENAYFFL